MNIIITSFEAFKGSETLTNILNYELSMLSTHPFVTAHEQSTHDRVRDLYDPLPLDHLCAVWASDHNLLNALTKLDGTNAPEFSGVFILYRYHCSVRLAKALGLEIPELVLTNTSEEEE